MKGVKTMSEQLQVPFVHITLNTISNLFLVYYENNPEVFACGITIEKALDNLYKVTSSHY